MTDLAIHSAADRRARLLNDAVVSAYVHELARPQRSRGRADAPARAEVGSPRLHARSDSRRHTLLGRRPAAPALARARTSCGASTHVGAEAAA